jgi:hypothetical protein
MFRDQFPNGNLELGKVRKENTTFLKLYSFQIYHKHRFLTFLL